MAKKRTITISPKIFINEPYIKCPKCEKNEFGVLMINRASYVRRCANCWHDNSFVLPKISKKLIYIDQFAISEMMKTLNPNDKANKKADQYWKKVFEKLHRLVKLQLIVCPETITLQEESLVAGERYKPIRRIYELLSYGVSFYDDATIRRFQVHSKLLEWLEHPQNKIVDRHDIVHDDIDKWQGRFIISVDMYGDSSEEIAEQIRNFRDQVGDGLNEVVAFWKKEKDFTFQNFYEREREHLSVGLSSNSLVLSQIFRDVNKYGNAGDDVEKVASDFIQSGLLKDIPYVMISSMMFASLARQFSSGGRVKPLSRGMMNDITVIASIAPYCDALFVDKECETIISQNQSRVGLDISAKIFSLNKKQEFLDYLDQIEKDASQSHLDLVKDVYGEDWADPYLEVFDSKV